MLLVYPVISFKKAIGHQGSKNNLIGKNASEEKIIAYSNEMKVTKQIPPTLLFHVSDDGAVNPMSRIEFYQALKNNKLPAGMHLCQSCGHGFGLYMKNSKELWMERCENWLLLNGWIMHWS